jgi:hypothetical protein
MLFASERNSTFGRKALILTYVVTSAAQQALEKRVKLDGISQTLPRALGNVF